VPVFKVLSFRATNRFGSHGQKWKHFLIHTLKVFGLYFHRNLPAEFSGDARIHGVDNEILDVIDTLAFAF
jgi:hypothetical protein